VAMDKAVDTAAAQAVRPGVSGFTDRSARTIHRPSDRTDIAPGRHLFGSAHVKAPKDIKATCLTPITRAMSSVWRHVVSWRRGPAPTWTMPEGSTLFDLHLPHDNKPRMLAAQRDAGGVVFKWSRNPARADVGCANYTVWCMAHKELATLRGEGDEIQQSPADDKFSWLLDLKSSITSAEVTRIQTILASERAAITRPVVQRLLEAPVDLSSPAVGRPPLDLIQEKRLLDHFIENMPPQIVSVTNALCTRLASELDKLDDSALLHRIQAEVSTDGSWSALKDTLRQAPRGGLDCVGKIQLASKILSTWLPQGTEIGPATTLELVNTFISATPQSDWKPQDLEVACVGALIAFKNWESSDKYRIDYDHLAGAVQTPAVKRELANSLRVARSRVQQEARPPLRQLKVETDTGLVVHRTSPVTEHIRKHLPRVTVEEPGLSEYFSRDQLLGWGFEDSKPRR
jgi:hypothetical protein